MDIAYWMKDIVMMDGLARRLDIGDEGELVMGGSRSGARPMPGCLEGAKVADNGDNPGQ